MVRESTTVWTRNEIAERILRGENLVIYHGQLLRIPQSWLQAHPGGALAILHFVGRDASDEIDAFHAEQTLDNRVKKYIIGKVQLSKDGLWEPLTPPVAVGWVRKNDGKGEGEKWVQEASPRTKADDNTLLTSEILLVGNADTNSKEKTRKKSIEPTMNLLSPPPSTLSLEEQTKHSRAYQELHKRITDAGLYETPYISGYGPEIVRYLTCYILSATAYWYGWYLSSAFFLGLVWHQLTFTAHDLGHMGVTHNWVLDRLLGTFIADFLGGLSIGWWVSTGSAPLINIQLTLIFTGGQSQYPSL
jgi:delta8-fatty-acid desaturase